jgi:ATP-dependent DNA helicase RecG
MSENSFIDELLKQKENPQIEFIPDFELERTLESICAFLNTEGGWIVIGHSGRKLLGLQDVGDNIVDEIQQNAYRRLAPLPLIYVQKIHFERQNILLINVLKGARKPYSFDGKFYVRPGRQTRLASADDISLLLRSSNEFTSTWEKTTVIDAAFDDLFLSEISRTMDMAAKLGRGRNLPKSPQEFLGYFQLYDYGAVKNGAVVLFGTSPTKFLPQCKIRITRMPEGKTGNRFDDTTILESNLFVAFERIQKYFRENLPIVSDFKSNQWIRSDRELYPLEALDEAVLNAMVHRDYGDVSGDITIHIYKEKIEIINSGSIPPNIIKDKSTIEPHHSILRNPMISQLFFLTGKMEKMGRGLSLIKSRFQENGLQNPEWVCLNGYTTLTLFGTKKTIELHDKMLEFLRQLPLETKFSRADYHDFFGGRISERTARLHIAKLIEDGWLFKYGNGPHTKFVRTSKQLPGTSG